jgi:hypothetical protein
LDSRLEERYRLNQYYKRFLDATTSTERERLVAELRKQLVQLMHWPAPTVNLDPVEKPWFSSDGINVSVVSLQTYPGLRLVCALLKPRDLSNSRPALLALHGFGGSLQSVVSDIDYHHGFGMKLSRAGFIILAPLRVTTSVETQSELQLKARAAGLTLEAIDLWQSARAIDYLVSIQEVDRSHVGVYGISWGGQHALRLGALDERLTLTITSGYFTDRFSWLFRRFPSSPAQHINVIPNMAVLLDDVNLVTLIQPRLFGVESGMRDPRHNSAGREFEKVRALYRHIGYPDRAQFLSFDGGHEISVETVLPFLKRWRDSVALKTEPRGPK